MRIKKTIQLFGLVLCMGLSSMQMQAQEKDSSDKVIWLRNTSFYFTNSFYFGDNMMADSHRTHNMGGDVKLGIVRYNKIGLALFAGFTKLKVNDVQMIGLVTKSQQTKVGGTIFYQLDLTPKSTFKPEIGIYDISFTSNGYYVEIESMSGTGLLFGTDYQYNIAKRFRAVVGLHYHWNKYKVQTAKAYKHYFERANYIQLSVGFNF
ncbi:hypothetical protein ACPDHL_02325 [Myroides sp. C15-4]|uniref:hypothetical protein n=1 Tax=Myroides sp. C15-4 TaxID=3400532 RepID=UPI003D2F82CB